MDNNVETSTYPKLIIDTSLVFEEELTPDMYLLLYLKYNNSKHIKLLNLTISNKVLEYLNNLNYIKITEDGFQLRSKGISLFDSSNFEKMFYELLSLYPIKVNSGGTVRVLRSRDLDALINKKCKDKYFKIIKNNKRLHDKIIKNLEKELSYKKHSNSMGYMQTLEVWLNKRTWELYDDEDLEVEENSSEESLN